MRKVVSTLMYGMTTMQALAAVASVAAMFLLAFAVRAVGIKWHWSAELQRKTMHVGVGVHAMMLPLFLERAGFLLFAGMALLALIFLRTPWMAVHGPGAAIHGVERRSWGDILFLASVCVLFLRAPASAEYYVLPICVLTVSDTVAALIGTSYGRLKFGMDGLKSIEGTVAFVLVTWVVVVTVLLLFTDIDRSRVVWLATVVSSIAALVEADSWSGLDNIFIPLGIYAFLHGWGNAPLWELGLSAMAWIMVLFGARALCPLVKLTPHAFRTAFAMLFLTAGFNHWAIAIYAIVTFGAHLFARRPVGHRACFSDLEFVVAFCLLGLAWLIIGMLGGRPEVEFYSMCLLSMVAGYASLVVPCRNLPARLMAGLAGAIMVLPLYLMVNQALPDTSLWMPRQQAVLDCMASALFCAVLTALFPGWFLRRRPDMKIAMLCFPLPFLIYGFQ